MEFKKRSLKEIADMICGNFEAGKTPIFNIEAAAT